MHKREKNTNQFFTGDSIDADIIRERVEAPELSIKVWNAAATSFPRNIYKKRLTILKLGITS